MIHHYLFELEDLFLLGFISLIMEFHIYRVTFLLMINSGMILSYASSVYVSNKNLILKTSLLIFRTNIIHLTYLNYALLIWPIWLSIS